MTLYNLKSADGDWRITKFDNELNVESSYLVSRDACECPAGHRPSCRHRQMLPKMLAAGAEDSGMFYNFDHDVFLEPSIANVEQTFDESEIAELPDGVEKDNQLSSREVELDKAMGTDANDWEKLETALSQPPQTTSPHPQGTIRRRI